MSRIEPLTEKELKFQKRKYDYCPHTLQRITDFKEAYYDEKLDLMFISRSAYYEYLKETRLYGKASRKKDKKIKTRRKKSRSVA